MDKVVAKSAIAVKDMKVSGAEPCCGNTCFSQNAKIVTDILKTSNLDESTKEIVENNKDVTGAEFCMSRTCEK